MEDKGLQFYEYVKSKGVSVPDSFEEFQSGLENPDTAAQFMKYLSTKNIKTPGSVTEFQDVVLNNADIPKKDVPENMSFEELMENKEKEKEEAERFRNTPLSPLIPNTGKREGEIDFFDQAITDIDKDFMFREEETVVPELKYRFKDHGFEFDESGVGDNVIVTASNGETDEFNLDSSGDASSESLRLKSFLIKNRGSEDVESMKRIEARQAYETKRFMSQEQVELATKSLNDDMDILVSEEKDLYNVYQEISTYGEKFEGLTQGDLDDNPELKADYDSYKARVDEFQSMSDVLKNNRGDLIDRRWDLTQSVGAYFDMKTDQGEFSSALYNQFLLGIGDVGATGGDIMIDVSIGTGDYGGVTPRVYTDMMLEQALSDERISQEDYDRLSGMAESEEEVMKFRDKNGLYTGDFTEAPKELQKSKENSDLILKELKGLLKEEAGESVLGGGVITTTASGVYDDMESSVKDKLKKKSKYGEDGRWKGGKLESIQNGLVELIGSGNVSDEYLQGQQDSFLGGSLLGLSRSLPAMVAGSITGGSMTTVLMGAQINAAIKEEMANNPEFDDVSENERMAISAPIAIAAGALEAFGIRNMKATSGVMNRLVRRAFTKSAGKQLTAKSFDKIIKDDIKSGFTRGALKLTGAGLAEAETGAAQEFAEVGMKKIYNYIKDEEKFETATGMQWIQDIAMAGAQEAVGGFILGSPGAVVTGLSNTYDEFSNDLPDMVYEAFNIVVGDPKIREGYISSINAQVADGSLTREEADEKIKTFKIAGGIAQSIPSDMRTSEKKQAFKLLYERQVLESSIEGKDKSLTKKEQGQIGEINKKIEALKEKSIKRSTKKEKDFEASNKVIEGINKKISELREKLSDTSITKKEKNSLQKELASLENDLKIEKDKSTETDKQEGADIESFFEGTEGEDGPNFGTNTGGKSQVLSDKQEAIVNKIKSRVEKVANSLKSSVPGVRILLHENADEYKRITGKSGGGAYIIEDGKGTIHINLSKARASTLAHEAFHAVFLHKLKTDSNAARAAIAMIKSVEKVLDPNSQLAKDIKAFSAIYKDEGEGIQNEEKLAELVGRISSEYKTLSRSAKDKVIDLLKKLANKIGFKFEEDFGKSDQDVIDLLNTLARKFESGEEITEKDTDVIGKDIDSDAEQKPDDADRDKVVDEDMEEEIFTPGSQILGGTNIRESRQAKVKDFDTTPPKVDGIKMIYPEKTSIDDVLEKSGGAAVFINSDGTKAGKVVVNGRELILQGGIDYTFIEQNVKDDIGFAASENKKISTLKTAASDLVDERDRKNPEHKGKPIAVFVVSQNGETMLGEWYAAEYIMEGLDASIVNKKYNGGLRQAEKDFVEAIKSAKVGKTEDGLRDKKSKDALLKMVEDGKFKTHEGRLEIARKLASKDFSFGFRVNLNKDLLSKKETVSPKEKNINFKTSLAESGHFLNDFWEKFIDERFLKGIQEERTQTEKGKTVSNKTFSGFFYDQSESLESQINHAKLGVDHAQFNSSFKSQGNFLLDSAYDVNKLRPLMGYPMQGGIDVYNEANNTKFAKGVTKRNPLGLVRATIVDKGMISKWLKENGYSKLIVNPYSSIALSLYTGVSGVEETVTRKQKREDADGLPKKPSSREQKQDTPQTREQIIGENAELSQNVRDNLSVAREMGTANKDTKTIRIATGWEKGADGKWRYEIDDVLIKDDFSYKDLKRIPSGLYSGKLSDVINNEKLFDSYSTRFTQEVDILNDDGSVEDFKRTDNYPPISDIKVYFEEVRGGTGVLAEYNPFFKTITINIQPGNSTNKQISTVLLHEIQHYIQGREGFARGGNSGMFDNEMDTLSFGNVNALRSFAKDVAIKNPEKGWDITYGSDAVKKYEEFFGEKPSPTVVTLASVLEQQLSRGIDLDETTVYKTLKNNNLTSFEKYKRLAGEVESRNVEKRMNMTSEQRRASILEETEDVARKDQIFFTEEQQTREQRTERLAPNGKRSNLDNVQYDNVRTPAFKKWFGDWENDPKNASKVVDENGEPLVVYHGTDSMFEIFEEQDSGKGFSSGKDFYFTDSEENASTYITPIKKEKGRVLGVFLNQKNPMIEDAEGRTFKNINGGNDNTGRIFKKDADSKYGGKFVTDPRGKVKNKSINDYASLAKKNNDGLIVKNVLDSGTSEGAEETRKRGGDTTYVTFKSIQSKLADGSNKTFDPDAPSIREDRMVESPSRMTAPQIILEARQNNFSDAAIRDYLIRVRGYSVKQVDEALKFDIDAFESLPQAFRTITGGVIAGLRLYNRVKAYRDKLIKANNKLKNPQLSESEIKAKVAKKLAELKGSVKYGTKTNKQIDDDVRKFRDKEESNNKKRKTKLTAAQVNDRVRTFREKLQAEKQAKIDLRNKAITNFEKTERKANEKRKPRMSEQEIMDKAIEFLEKQPEYLAERETYTVGSEKEGTKQTKFREGLTVAQASLVSAFQSNVGVRPTKSVAEKLKKARRMLRDRKKGARDLNKIKNELRHFIRRALPNDLYKKTEVLKLIKLVTDANEGNIENIFEQVEKRVTEMNNTTLIQKISKMLDLKQYAKKDRNGKIIKGRRIDPETLKRLEGIVANLIDPSMDVDELVKAVEERVDSLQKQIDELNSKKELSVEDVSKIVDLNIAMQYNQSMLLDNDNIYKTAALDSVHNSLEELITFGRAVLQYRINKRHKSYVEQLERMYYDITGNKIDMSQEGAKEKLDEMSLNIRNKAKKDRVDRRLKGIFQKLKSYISFGIEDLSGYMDIISTLPGDIFEGETQEIVTDRIDASTRAYKGRMLQIKEVLETKLMEVYGKSWEKEIQESRKLIEETEAILGYPLSRDQIIYLYNQYRDPSNHSNFKSQYGAKYEEKMEKLFEFLTKEDKEFADYQVNELFPSLYEYYNPIYKRIYDAEMPWSMVYAGPLRYDGVTETEFDLLQGTTSFQKSMAPGSAIKRVNNQRKISEESNIKNMTSYMQEMEYWAAYAENLRDINKLFQNDAIRDAITSIHGPKLMKLIDDSIAVISKKGGKVSEFDRIVNGTNSLFSVTRLALSPVIYLKQLTSAFAYANDIGYRNWVKYSIKNIIEFRKLSKEIMENSIYLKDRYDKSITRTLETYKEENSIFTRPKYFIGDKGISGDDVVSFMMGLVTAGDRHAIIIGGMPNYKLYKDRYMKENPEATEQEAVDYAIIKFEKDTKKAQQSSDLQDKDLAQTGNPIYRSFNMFLTTSKQYLRKEFYAIRQIYTKIRQWDRMAGKGTLGQNLRTLTTFHVVLPMIFQYVTSGLPGLLADWEDEDGEDLLRAAIMGNINGLFILGDFFVAAADYAQDKPWAFDFKNLTVYDIMGEIGDSVKRYQKLKPGPKKEEAYWTMIATIAQAKTIKKWVENLQELPDSKNVNEAIMRLLNYSEYQISGGKKSKKSAPKSSDKEKSLSQEISEFEGS